jgi:hypothetical protein
VYPRSVREPDGWRPNSLRSHRSGQPFAVSGTASSACGGWPRSITRRRTTREWWEADARYAIASTQFQVKLLRSRVFLRSRQPSALATSRSRLPSASRTTDIVGGRPSGARLPERRPVRAPHAPTPAAWAGRRLPPRQHSVSARVDHTKASPLADQLQLSYGRFHRLRLPQ